MQDLNTLTEEIYSDGSQITVFNIFFKTSEVEKEIHREFVSKFATCNTFEKFKNVFSYDMSNIMYIKTYSRSIGDIPGLILYNPVIYTTNEPEQNVLLDSSNKNMIFTKDSESENTNKIITYLLTKDNFLRKLINKQNSKNRISIPMVRDLMFNENRFNRINNKNNNTPGMGITYVQGENNLTFKKINVAQCVIKDEQIWVDLRFMLPESTTICLMDMSYICSNKIIVSSSRTCGNIEFGSIQEKLKFLFDIYISFFQQQSNVNNIKMSLGISTKMENKFALQKNASIFPLHQNITINNKFLTLKYIQSIENYRKYKETIDIYLKKQKKTIKQLGDLDPMDLLLYNEKNVEVVFSALFDK